MLDGSLILFVRAYMGSVYSGLILVSQVGVELACQTPRNEKHTSST
jgi:hypothetical protein